jgi:phosphoenolpyruvate carboxykinase (ATP)
VYQTHTFAATNYKLQSFMNRQINRVPDLGYLYLAKAPAIHYQLNPAQLVEAAIHLNEGQLSDTGALAIDTGMFTGRSPKDRFIVDDHISHDNIWWGPVNYKYDGAHFNALFRKMTKYLSEKELFVRDAAACANEKYHLDLRVITETAYQNLFVHHLFLRPEMVNPAKRPEWTIIAAPGFHADPEIDGTRQKNFTIISFSKKVVLIGGTGYTGEIKKAIFTVLNFTLAYDQEVLPMHCSANIGRNGDTALFFGLSGTGKTTLSADPERRLIGDDEHGWSAHSVFNFEGGCYAKCSGLTAEHEPQIFGAIQYGALLENINFLPGTRRVNYNDTDKTENTRVAYPLSSVSNAVTPSLGAAPKNIFFLTADALGVLPPISRLSTEQAMYHFLSGYTAKITGTETDVAEPKLTFSACFGEAFLPLQPMVYAMLLGEKIREQQVNVWMINTGWTGGGYGKGRRISLAYTRSMIRAALTGSLNEVNYLPHPVFHVQVPLTCPNVPDIILDPKNTWEDKEAYEESAGKLAQAFYVNFQKYMNADTKYLLSAGPVVAQVI